MEQRYSKILHANLISLRNDGISLSPSQQAQLLFFDEIVKTYLLEDSKESYRMLFKQFSENYISRDTFIESFFNSFIMDDSIICEDLVNPERILEIDIPSTLVIKDHLWIMQTIQNYVELKGNIITPDEFKKRITLLYSKEFEQSN